MPVSIVVGGQFGSEGKGKVAHYFAKRMEASVAIRCGGTNSGHTVIDTNGQPHIFRQLPTAALLPEVKLALCAGSYIDVDILREELTRTGVDDRRIMIDPYSVIITPEHKLLENKSGLIGDIGSTGSGTGEAVIARIQRKNNVVFAKDVPELSEYIKDVNAEFRLLLKKGQRIILEGTQGFGLSPLHSKMNPYVTSRDTTASGFLSEAGLSPFDVDEVVMVIRAFPIRVNGNSGPLEKETSWDVIGGKERAIHPELTSVTNRMRRVAFFDHRIVCQSINCNDPSVIILNHLDYLDLDAKSFSLKTRRFVQSVEKNINSRINYIGFGRSENELLEVPE